MAIPSMLFASAWITDYLSGVLNLWAPYVAALLIPSSVLISVYLITPVYRLILPFSLYGLMMVTNYALFTPIQYPEGSEHAYQWTHRPFLISLMLSSLLIMVFLVREKAIKLALFKRSNGHESDPL